MRFRVLKIGISSVLFTAMVLAALVSVRPAILRFEQSLVQFRDSVLLQVERRTGLRISYDSISPSILSAFSIKGIVVSDSLADVPLLEIGRVTLTYRARELLGGNFAGAFKKLTVSGITVDYDSEANRLLLERLAGLISAAGDGASDAPDGKDAASGSSEKAGSKDGGGPGATGGADGSARVFSAESGPSGGGSFLPFDVEVRDVSLRYRDELVDALVTISDVGLRNTADGMFLDAAVDGRVSLELLSPLLARLPPDIAAGLRGISAGFAASASLPRGLDGSTARVRLSSVRSSGLSVSGLGFVAGYSGGVVRVSTMQDRLPFSVGGSLDLESRRLSLRAEMDGFDPFSLVTVRGGNPTLDKVRGATISGSYGFSWNGAGSSAAYSYSADGSLFLPPALVPGGADVAYDISGTSSDVVVRSLSVRSDVADLLVEGSCNIPKMRLSGTAFLEKLVVPGGGVVSAEMYLDPLDAGFVCFVPQVYLDERSLTAMQLTVIPDAESRSIDFGFEVSDYSHIDFGAPGVLSVSGSLIGGGSAYAQAQVSISDFFLDTVVETAAFFMPDKGGSLDGLSRALSSFMMTNELYVATDFSSVTYNAPYWIVASTEQDKGLLVFSFTGNESNLSLSQLDLVYGASSVRLSADVGMDRELGSAFFTADAAVNSIPYSLAGSFMPEAGLSVTGSYGLSLTLAFGDDGNGRVLDGSLGIQELPVALGRAVLACSADLSARVPLYDPAALSVDIAGLSVSEVSGLLAFGPTVTLAGKVNSFGLMLDSLVYSDSVSLLNGSGGVMWSLSEGTIGSASLNLALASAVTSESYGISATVSNPGGAPFSAEALMRDFYFSAQVDVTDFPMSRVRQMQADTDVCTASVTAMGTAENPYVAVSVAPSSMSFSGVPFSFGGSALLDDGVVYLHDAGIFFGRHTVSGIEGRFSLPDFAGELNATYDGSLGRRYTVHAPVRIAVASSAAPGDSGIPGLAGALSRGIPEYVSAELDATLGGTMFAREQPVSLDIVRVPGYVSIASGDGLGISGTVTDEGELSVLLEGRMPIHGNIHGFVSESGMDINATDIRSDLSRFSHMFNFPFIALHGGTLVGDAHVGGILADPDFSGDFTASELDLSSPNYVAAHLVGREVPIVMRDNELRIDGVPFDVGSGGVVLDLSMTMDRWKLGLLTLKIRTPGNVFIPALVDAPPVLIDGMATCDLDIAVTLNSCDLSGRFYAENVDIELLGNSVAAAYSRRKDFRVTLDIDVTTGQHVEIELNPLLRGLIEPNTNFLFQYDSSTRDFALKSDITLRGGEVTYLNRNFYLREGRVVLDESGSSFDPRLTVRAEIRERDEAGEPVRITLSAQNQRLSEFSPSYTSSPPRSELELMTMLGQAATGDIQDGWDVLLTWVDYGFQVFVLRKVENALRDLLNFDIFSLRTMGLQNSLRQWLDASSDSEPLTISNFLDNTTVYIGKYFGSSIYADALFHFAYDEARIASGESVSGLVFQPEIGLEMDSPFATIRWSLAPEIGTTQHLWVPATSITLSWKFVF